MTGGGESHDLEESSSVACAAASAAAVASAVISCSSSSQKTLKALKEVTEEPQVDEPVENGVQMEEVVVVVEEEEQKTGYLVLTLCSEDQEDFSTSSSSSGSSTCSEPDVQQVPEVMETSVINDAPLKSVLKKTGDKLSKKGLRVSFLFEGPGRPQPWTGTNGDVGNEKDQDPPVLLTVREFQVPLDDYHASPAVVNLSDEADRDSLTKANLKKHEILMEEVIQETLVLPALPGPRRPRLPPPPPPLPPPPAVTVTSPKNISVKNSPQKALNIPHNLSPPLKELTVDLPSFGDNWQIELSPLSSVPDSVSSDGSTVSSQETIIMMTSEESRRNEEHMRRSRIEYRQSLEECPAMNQSSSSASSTSSSSSSSSSSGSSESVDSVKSKPAARTNSQIRRVLQKTALRRTRLRASDAKRRPANGSLADRLDDDDTGGLEDVIRRLTTDDNDEFQGKNEKMRQSLKLGGSAPELTRMLTSKSSGTAVKCSNGSSVNGVQDVGEDLDELARFVEVGSERLERLRKRYSYSEDEDDGQGFGRRPSVRGIKPRFGSTHEILQQMQQKMQVHPLMANPSNTMTWPYGVSMVNYGQCRPRRSGMREPRLPQVYEDAQEDNAKRNGTEGNYWNGTTLVRGATEQKIRPPPPPYGSDPRHLRYVNNYLALDVNRNG